MSGPSRSVTAIIDAPAELVWELISNLPRMSEWSQENQGGEWIAGTPGEVGARFRGRNKRGRASWSTTCEVLEAERGRSFVFGVGTAGRPDTTWRYELNSLPGGRTEVVEQFTMRKPAGAVTRLLTRLTTGVRDRDADLEEGMRLTLERLAATARREAGAADLPGLEVEDVARASGPQPQRPGSTKPHGRVR